jgi:hypothetical protein
MTFGGLFTRLSPFFLGKDTIRDEIYSLTSFLCFESLKRGKKQNRGREGKAEVVPFICQNRRFHISNTHSALALEREDEDEGEQSDEKFNSLLCPA